MERKKKISAFGLNVQVIKAQQACFIIYFLITFIFSLPKVFQRQGRTMNVSKRGETWEILCFASETTTTKTHNSCLDIKNNGQHFLFLLIRGKYELVNE